MCLDDVYEYCYCEVGFGLSKNRDGSGDVLSCLGGVAGGIAVVC